MDPKSDEAVSTNVAILDFAASFKTASRQRGAGGGVRLLTDSKKHSAITLKVDSVRSHFSSSLPFGPSLCRVIAPATMAESDRLEKLNTVNASSMTLKVRVLMPFDRATKGMHVFGCYLVSETGAYTMGEALVYGDTPEKRQTALQALQKKWVDKSAWQLTRIKANKKNNQFHSAPHPAYIDLNAGTLQASKLSPADAEQLPTEIEPRLLPDKIRALSTSQCVDTLGVCTGISDVKPQKSKHITEIKLCAEDGSELLLNMWDDTQNLARGHSVGEILLHFQRLSCAR